MLLTKSKFLSGIQCHKYLWISVNDKSKIPPADPATQFLFDQGHEVGEYAKKLFPEGIDVPYVGFKESIAQTEKLLLQRKPLFEASILANDLYSRVDVLNPVDDDLWDIIEVKSTTSVKDEHVWDVGFQKHCCEKAGLKIRRCQLMYLNNEYVRDGDLDLSKLFHIEDITDQVNVVYDRIPLKVKEMFEAISQGVCPEIAIGMHCLEPYECPLKDHCWSFLPERNIFNLYWLRKEKKFELLEQGLKTIEEIPDYYDLSDKQHIQKQSIVNNEAHVEKQEIRDFLQQLEYPLYYLDFETFNPAIPPYDGTRPYKRIPFQYSLHVNENEGSEVQHYSFLADGSADPRPLFLESLKKVIGRTGSVIVYNQKFEEGILNELIEAYPESEAWVKNVIGRMVDLLDPFKAFHYHHPDQNGSASLKNVLPVLTGQTYKEMSIQDGDQASRMFVEVFVKNNSPKDRDQARKDLEDYCHLDTQAMIDIVNGLQRIVEV